MQMTMHHLLLLKPNALLAVFCIVIASLLPLAHAEENTRIATVDGNATEIIKALGYNKYIVAADVTSQGILKDHPNKNLGYHRTLSTEGLLEVAPTVVIGSHHMGPEKVIQTLKQTQIELIQLTSPQTVEQLINNIKQLGQHWQDNVKTKTLISEIEQQHLRIQQLTPTQKSMVFLFDMGDRGLSQAGTDTAGGALVNLLNGNNISRQGSYKPISMEALLAQNPDIILIGQQSDALADISAILTQYPLLGHSKAAKQGRIIPVNAATLIAGLSIGALNEAERIATILNQISD